MEKEGGTVYTIVNQINVRNAVEPRSACISEYGLYARLVSSLNTSHAIDTTYREILHLNTNRSAVADRSACISENATTAASVAARAAARTKMTVDVARSATS